MAPTETESVAVELDLSDTQGHVRLDLGRLRSTARDVLAGEGIGRASLSVAAVDDAAIRPINRRHLGHDWPTDVISFLLSEPGDEVLAGELVISAETAARVAAERGVDPAAEFALYLVHGLLHLCGYDDQTDTDAARMRRREEESLAAAGWPRPSRDEEAGT